MYIPWRFLPICFDRFFLFLDTQCKPALFVSVIHVCIWKTVPSPCQPRGPLPVLTLLWIKDPFIWLVVCSCLPHIGSPSHISFTFISLFSIIDFQELQPIFFYEKKKKKLFLLQKVRSVASFPRRLDLSSNRTALFDFSVQYPTGPRLLCQEDGVVGLFGLHRHLPHGRCVCALHSPLVTSWSLAILPVRGPLDSVVGNCMARGPCSAHLVTCSPS